MASFLVKSSAVDDGFCGMVDRRKTSSLIPCQDHCQRPLSEILTITNLRYTVNRIWTCAEPEFRLGWMELCSSDNHFTTAPCYSKFTRKHLCRSHFFLKIAGWKTAILLKRDSSAGIFLCILRSFTEETPVNASARHRIFFFRTLATK